MKVTSKLLYKTLRDVMAPTLQDAGFRRTTGGMPGWHREGVTFWFQCEKYGWWDDWGSSFTLEFQRGEAGSEPGMGSMLTRRRYFELLDRDELEQVRLENNRVIESLPGTSKGAAVFVPDDEGGQVCIEGHVPADEYANGEDIWLHFYTVGDVEGWGQFFDDRILRLVWKFTEITDNEQAAG